MRNETRERGRGQLTNEDDGGWRKFIMTALNVVSHINSHTHHKPLKTAQVKRQFFMCKLVDKGMGVGGNMALCEMDDEKLLQISDERAPGGLVLVRPKFRLCGRRPKKVRTEDLLGHNVIAHNNNHRQWHTHTHTHSLRSSIFSMITFLRRWQLVLSRASPPKKKQARAESNHHFATICAFQPECLYIYYISYTQKHLCFVPQNGCATPESDGGRAMGGSTACDAMCHCSCVSASHPYLYLSVRRATLQLSFDGTKQFTADEIHCCSAFIIKCACVRHNIECV